MSRVQQQQYAWQQHCTKWVDMLEWVEAHAPEPPGRIVAKEVRDEAMRGLVKSDRDNHRKGPNRDEVDGVTGH
jgi:hypothetical protein